MTSLIPVSDDQLFEAFDLLARQWGIRPPETPGQQFLVSRLIGAFFAGARLFQHIQETHESSLPQFALPGIDFDPDLLLSRLQSRERSPKK